jgi:flagellar basal body-associated protein FliL
MNAIQDPGRHILSTNHAKSVGNATIRPTDVVMYYMPQQNINFNVGNSDKKDIIYIAMPIMS